MLIAGPSWASRGRGSGFEQCLVTKASGSKLDFSRMFFSCFSKGCGAVQVSNSAICHAHFDMDSCHPAIHPTPSHLVTPLHLALTILQPSSTQPSASPVSCASDRMAFYALSGPTSFVLAFCLPDPQGLIFGGFPNVFVAHNSCPSSTSSSSWT